MVIGPSVQEEKIFEGFLPYMGVAAIFVKDPAAVNNIPFPLPKEAPNKFAYDWPSVFGEEDVLNCGRRTDIRTDVRRSISGYTISSPMSLQLR